MSQSVDITPNQSTATPLVVVKKYANRRLYNTESSSYITLDNLAEMIRHGRDFVVYDAKSGEDITRSVLTQIIVEEEGKGRAMLPISFLRHLIGFYGGNLQGIVPRYLEQTMAAFAQQQQQMRASMQQTMGGFFQFGNMEEVSRQNLAMMERAMSLFTPFYRPQDGSQEGDEAAKDHVPASDLASAQQEIDALRAELREARKMLAAARADCPEAHGKDFGRSSLAPSEHNPVAKDAKTELDQQS